MVVLFFIIRSFMLVFDKSEFLPFVKFYYCMFRTVVIMLILIGKSTNQSYLINRFFLINEKI